MPFSLIKKKNKKNSTCSGLRPILLPSHTFFLVIGLHYSGLTEINKSEVIPALSFSLPQWRLAQAALML